MKCAYTLRDDGGIGGEELEGPGKCSAVEVTVPETRVREFNASRVREGIARDLADDPVRRACCCENDSRAWFG